MKYVVHVHFHAEFPLAAIGAAYTFPGSLGVFTMQEIFFLAIFLTVEPYMDVFQLFDGSIVGKFVYMAIVPAVLCVTL